MFSYKQGSLVLKIMGHQLFLLIHGQKSHPALSVKISLWSGNVFFVMVGGKPAVTTL